MLELILGKDWTANTDTILTLVARDVAEEKPGRILLVPELISHDMERRLCAASGDTASRFAEVLSFTRLARRVADSVGAAAMQCLDNGGRLVAMAAAAKNLHSRLKVYAAVETKPEFLADMINAVDEFKRCCITAEDLKAASLQSEGAFAQKLEELALLLESYDALCHRGKRDPRDQMSWVLEQLEDSSFAETHTFYIDGFPDFTRQHMAILEHLIRSSPYVAVSLNCDRVNSEVMAYEKAGATALQLQRCAQQLGVPVKITVVPEKPSPLLPVREKLFQGKIPAGSVPGEVLRLTTAPSVYQSCCQAAEDVLAMVRSGSRYRDIGVVCADLPGYAPVLGLVFRRYRIPVYLSGTDDILQKGPVVTVLSALEAVLGGFEQRVMQRYLRSVLSPLDPDTCDLVENYTAVWAISGNRWKEPWQYHPDRPSG